MAICKLCDTRLSRKNETGFCRQHWRASVPAWEPKPRHWAVIDAVCVFYRTDRKTLASGSRLASNVRARHMASWLLHKIFSLPSPKIGALLGNRDHSTILHGLSKIRRDLASPTLRSLADELEVYARRAIVTGCPGPTPRMRPRKLSRAQSALVSGNAMLSRAIDREYGVAR